MSTLVKFATVPVVLITGDLKFIYRTVVLKHLPKPGSDTQAHTTQAS